MEWYTYLPMNVLIITGLGKYVFIINEYLVHLQKLYAPSILENNDNTDYISVGVQLKSPTVIFTAN